jgi:hypothetical protein
MTAPHLLAQVLRTARASRCGNDNPVNMMLILLPLMFDCLSGLVRRVILTQCA